MAQFEIRRALPQVVQRITEIYNSNTEFLLHHLGRERVDHHIIAREMEEMRCVGFLSCVLVERESGRCVGVSTMVKQLACAGGQHAPSGVRC